MSVEKEINLNNLNEALTGCPLTINDIQKKQQIESKLKCLHIDGPTALRISELFVRELKAGLQGKPSSMLMLNTYIPQLPDGTEEGQFLALDLGGTNFRVLYLELQKGRIVKEQSEHYHINNELRVGCGMKLFDFLAECISSFVHKHNLAEQTLPLGFTFSFPMEQKSISSAKLLMWAISFSASGVVGEDIVRLLSEALHRKGLSNVKVVAIINDSTGTLLYGGLMDSKTKLGVILGTGTNGCYMEKAENVPHWNSGVKEVAINTEWGCFADSGVIDFIKTDYDIQVDSNSHVKNVCVFEKYTGGGFLGELVRYVLLDLEKSGLMFQEGISDKLLKEDSFTAPHITGIEEDTANNTTAKSEKILTDYGQKYSEDDVQVLKYICEMVSRRSALLISICCAEILKHMGRPDSTIAVDGSLYKYHPRIRHWITDFVSILAPGHKFKFIEAHDGSGKGAAIAAAVALKLKPL